MARDPRPETGAGHAPAPGASFGALLAADFRRSARVMLLACAALAGFELVAALLTSPAHDVRVLAGVRLLFLSFTLVGLSWLILGPLLGLAAVAMRLGLALHGRDRARAWRGLLSPAPEGFQPAAPWLWAGFAGALLYVAASAYATFRAITWFKEPQLTSLLLALGQLVLLALVGALILGLGPLLSAAGRRLDAWLAARAERPWVARARRLQPLGRAGPALVCMLLLGLPAMKLAVHLMPQLAPKIPWRHILAVAVLAAAAHGAAAYLGRRASRPARRPLRTAGMAAASALLGIVTLTHIGADHEAKSVAITGSPLLANLIDVVRKGTDFDRDGYGFLLGENDCAPFAGDIHPLARDIAENQIDEDCNGRDFSFQAPPAYRAGERMPVPEGFRRDWNILLLTVDTVRYDHTGFGGYLEKTGRDTTPNLDDLVARSVSFTFANAPSAGTMASVPSILTSKFFHSGIALDENVPPRTPPRLKPENLLISEITKDRGYYNGAILTHVYFEDWGMEQGFDTYDNEIGAEYQPRRVTSHEVTDKALAWIARNQGRKWFLWAHYLDPHGYYVPHPGEKSFGTTEEDLYDGELHYTDKHLGRLFKELASMPGADRTIIIITSDHGDGFNEHGFINHGQALYRELLHVPLIVYIPGVPPRQVDGAVSPLDIVPTVADLVGFEHDPAQFEGESLVPQLFYQKDVRGRVVFAETDWPEPQRAAVTSASKLIYKLKRNIYELYDLKADPWEKRNIGTRDREVFDQMKRYLDSWLERVYYDRDALSNQQIYKLRGILLTSAPAPRHPAPGTRFDQGRIQVLGFDTDKDAYRPGDDMRVSVYFHVPGERPTEDFQIQVQAWEPAQAPDGKPGRPVQSKLRYTAGGVLPTSRWRQGEYIRDTLHVRIPGSWKGERVAIGVAMNARRSGWQAPSGPTREDTPQVAVIGQIPLQQAPAAGAGSP